MKRLLIYLFLIVFVMLHCALPSQGMAVTPEATPNGVPVSSLLTPDGRLDLSQGFAGSIDMQGYRMTTDVDGTPRFVPGSHAERSVRSGPESGPDDAYWDDQFPLPGVDESVYAAVADGTGNVYVGGDFNAVGNTLANGIAKWDGMSWSPLGTGVNGSVRAIAVDGTDIYAGGSFSTAGGIGAQRIAKWDGTSWSPLGTGTNEIVYAIAIHGGNVYAGGFFTAAGAVSANRVAKWDGTSWSALGSGLNGTVYALGVGGGVLYAGGEFTAGSSRVARWDGTQWMGVGGWFDGKVYALAVSGTEVYAGGLFTIAGGIRAYNVARWNGLFWSPLGDGVHTSDYSPAVYALTIDRGNLYAGGSFNWAGNTSALRIAKWDGAAWSAMGTLGPDYYDRVRAIAVTSSGVIAGGLFRTADGSSARRVAKWNGTSWSQMAGGLNWPVSALVACGSEFYAGGSFDTIGTLKTNHIARWNGKSWSSLGKGLGGGFGSVRTIAVEGSLIYAGGLFTTAGEAPANNIAKWDGTSWSPLGEGTESAVSAIAVDVSDVYAGGDFTTAGPTAANHIAKWDGTSWSALGSGIDGRVNCLAASGGKVYAGGDFKAAGGIGANSIAMWDGTTWAPLGSGIEGTVNAIAVSGKNIYAGGTFTVAGGVEANYIARWDGTTWSPLGNGTEEVVLAIAADDDCVYAGCTYTTVGGMSANHVVKWNGSCWSAFATGPNREVTALAMSGNVLAVGGGFTAAGNHVSGYFAVWQPRVNVTTATVSASPGTMTIGDDVYGFYKPALMTGSGTAVTYTGGLPATVSIDRAEEIHVNGNRVNGAFTLSPEGMQFGGDGAVLRVEFSEDDAAHFGCAYTDFRAARLVYPPDYPASKEAAGAVMLSNDIAVPIRMENGRQIYAITVPVTEIGSTYGAIPISQWTDVSLTKTAAPDTAAGSGRLTYTLTVTNAGPVTATGVTVRDALPGSVTLTSVSSSQGVCTVSSDDVLSCSLGSIAAGASAEVTMVVTVAPGSTTVTNTASVVTDQFDTNPGNNTASVTSLFPDVSLTKTAAPDPVTSGAALTYTMTVTNSGPAVATGVTLWDTLPQGAVFVSATSSQGKCSVPTAGVVACELGNMPTETTAAVAVVTAVTTRAGVLINTASVDADQWDPTPANNSAEAVSNVVIPEGCDLHGEWATVSARCRGTGTARSCTIRGRFTATSKCEGRSDVALAVFLCDQPTVGGSTDIRLTVRRLGYLRGGTTRQIPITVRLPRGADSAGKYLVVQIDSGNAVDEVDEENNWTVVGPLP